MKNVTFKTRHALLLSLLSLTTCFAMLLGTTFAWFTDSVTSGVNRIVAGNLDVELLHVNADTAATATDADKTVAGNTLLFNAAADEGTILWEPGAASYETFTIQNKGTLNLKYEFHVNNVGNNTMANDTSKSLLNALKVAVVEDGYTDAAKNAITTGSTTLGQLIANSDNLFTGRLTPAEGSKTFTVILYWPQSDADNQWNPETTGTNTYATSDGNQLYVNLGITLLATQETGEYDSFSNDYDGGLIVNNVVSDPYIGQQVVSATVNKTVDNESGAVTKTTLTANATPAGTEGNKETTVEFASDVDDSLTVTTKDIQLASAADSGFTVKEGDTPVASIKFEFTGTSVETFNGDLTSFATVTTYIATGLGSASNISITYQGNENGVVVKNIAYNNESGQLTFETNHFSEFAVGADVAALNYTTNAAYKTLQAAIDSVPKNTNNNAYYTILLLKDVKDAAGLATQTGAADGNPKNLIIDFGGHTYSMKTPAVGSKNTESQSMHWSEGSNITMKNGTYSIQADAEGVSMAMQGYAPLTLTNMVLDLSNVPVSRYGEYSGQYAAFSNQLVPSFNVYKDSTFTNTKIYLNADDTVGMTADNKVELINSTISGCASIGEVTSKIILDSSSRITKGVKEFYLVDTTEYVVVSSTENGKTVYTLGDARIEKLKAKAKAAGATNIAKSSNGVVGTMNDGVVYEWCADGSVYVADAKNFAGETYTVPEFVTGLGDSSFKNNITIKTLKITGNITSAKKALQGNSTITTVDFGSKMTSIPDRMFFGCTGITSLTLPTTITRIEDWAFYNNGGLVSLTASGQIEYIGYKAFDSCSALKTLDIQGSPAIMGWAGRGASAIETIIIRGKNATVNLDYAPAGEAKGSYVFCKEQTGNSGTMNNVTIYVANNSVAEQFASEQSLGATITVSNFPNTAQS